MKIIYNSKISKLFNYKGITIYPFIFITYPEKNCPKYIIKHEQKKYKKIYGTNFNLRVIKKDIESGGFK